MNPNAGPASRTSAPALSRPANFPEGLIGDIAEFIYRAAPYPNATIALAGAIGFLAGIAGRSYNVKNSGLNQYALVLAPTGLGKDAIADGIAQIMGAVQAKVPRTAEFRGPTELVSAAGLIKWIARSPNPSMYCVIGEFGLMLKAMAAPNANAHMAGLERALLQFYSKSGHGKEFGASAYSDRENNTAVIMSPSLTIIGEGVPESFYASFDERTITSGLLPRFLVFETNEARPYENADRCVTPSETLVEAVATLASECLNIAYANGVCHVQMTDDARAKFAEFERWTTDCINGAANEATKQLWNRSNMKAWKLAGLVAVSRNPHDPKVTLADCMWATNLVVGQTECLIAKFVNGETGNVAGDEVKQQNELVRIIAEYAVQGRQPDPESKYGLSAAMQRDCVFTQNYLSRRVLNLPTFKSDRPGMIGGTPALKRAILNMLEADEIREIPKAEMAVKYGTSARAFVISKPARFVKA